MLWYFNECVLIIPPPFFLIQTCDRQKRRFGILYSFKFLWYLPKELESLSLCDSAKWYDVREVQPKWHLKDELGKTKYFNNKFSKLKNNTNSKFQNLQPYNYDFIITYIYLQFYNYMLHYSKITILQINNFKLP